MSFLVTGAAGFIGSHLVSLLDNPACCDTRVPATYQPPELIEYITRYKPKAVFHLGAISSTTETNTGLIAENNILFSCRLLEKCIELNIPLVYASSASVYGLGKNGFSEDQAFTPMNYYAISKACFDTIVLQKIRDNPGAKIVGLRYFNVYGTGENHKNDMASPVHKFLLQAKESGEIKVFQGSHDFYRDFIYVSDAAQITKAAVGFASGIYNVGTGKPNSFLRVAEIIAELTGAEISEITFPEHLKEKYQAWTCSDNSKINEAYPSARTTLNEGITKVHNADRIC